MKIDYSYNLNWKYGSFIKIPFIYGIRHLYASFNSHLSQNISQRIQHLVLGILNLIPVVNFLVAGIEYSLKGRIRKIDLIETDPYKRGQEFGRKLRNEIQAMYKVVLKVVESHYDPIPLDEMLFELQNPCFKGATHDGAYELAFALFKKNNNLVEKLAAHKEYDFREWKKHIGAALSPTLKAEMQGLADGAGVSYDDVLTVHTFLDFQAGQNGCTVVGTHERERLVASNHSFNDSESSADSSFERQRILEKASLSDSQSYRRALAKAQQDISVQSIIFKPNENEVEIATGWGKSADQNWQSVSVLEKKSQDKANSKVRLARNLDWRWPICGSETVIVSVNPGENKYKYVNVTWPGYLGVLSGMNEKGVCIASAQCGNRKQIEGKPIPFLTKSILEKAENIKEAVTYIKNTAPASSMNLIITAMDGVARVELDPNRAPKGAALLHQVP